MRHNDEKTDPLEVIFNTFWMLCIMSLYVT